MFNGAQAVSNPFSLHSLKCEERKVVIFRSFIYLLVVDKRYNILYGAQSS